MQYILNFVKICKNMQQSLNMQKYAKKNSTISFKLWWFVEIIDKNPKILKGKKFVIVKKSAL
jgi:hypothetical protein